MKKILLIVLFISFNAQSQILFSEDFEGLPEGNMGVYPQNQRDGWYSMLYGGTPQFSDVKVVNIGGIHNKAIQITGNRNGDVKLGKIFSDSPYSWSNYQVEFDFYTGPLNATTQSVKVFLQSKLIVLAGLEINLGDLKVSGWGSYNPGLDPDYNKAYKLGTNNTDVYLSPNTWYRLGFSFRKGDGQMRFVEKSGIFNTTINAAAAGNIPDTFFVEIEYKSKTLVSSSAFVDNVTFEKTLTNTLSLEKNEIASDVFTVSPNPTNNFVTISNYGNKNVSSVLISDANGRISKEFNFKKYSDEIKLDVSNLNSGLYVMKIISNEGYVIKKIIIE